MSGGRPKGTRNTSGHAAGGKRAGAGRLPKVSFYLADLLSNFIELRLV